MTCTFFGHRDTPAETKSILRDAIVDMIENKNVDTFYMGNQGAFDIMVSQTLKELKKTYPHICFSVVLAYLPKKALTAVEERDTIFPEELDNVPARYAIHHRNLWMIDNSDYVITYVRYSYGGASKFKAIAEKKGKKVYNLAVK